MTIVLPEGDASRDVPGVPAKIAGFEPKLPADFIDGDVIRLEIELDRPLTPLELRLMDERGPTNWVGRAGEAVLLVEVAQLQEGTMKNVQKNLDRNHSWAIREAAKAAATQSRLTEIAEEWRQ